MIFHIATVVLFVLWATGIINISLWLVIAPSLFLFVALGFIILISFLGLLWTR